MSELYYNVTFILPTLSQFLFIFFFFNDPATTEIYTLSLHDALPISQSLRKRPRLARRGEDQTEPLGLRDLARSEEHTSELQSRSDLVCRLLLEKKKKNHESDIDIENTIYYNCAILCEYILT